MIENAKDLEYEGLIDPLENVKNEEILIFSGLLDDEVEPLNGFIMRKMFKKLGNKNVRLIDYIGVDHNWVSPYGHHPCNTKVYPWIVNCGDFNLAHEIFTQLYRNLKP